MHQHCRVEPGAQLGDLLRPDSRGLQPRHGPLLMLLAEPGVQEQLEYVAPASVVPGRDGDAALGVLLQLVLVPGGHHQQFRAAPHGGMQGTQVDVIGLLPCDRCGREDRCGEERVVGEGDPPESMIHRPWPGTWAEPYAETARRRALDAWTTIAEILEPASPGQASPRWRPRSATTLQRVPLPADHAPAGRSRARRGAPHPAPAGNPAQRARRHPQRTGPPDRRCAAGHARAATTRVGSADP